MLVDTHGRQVEYLRISVTDRCNLRCTYCMPSDGVALKPFGDILSFERMTQVAEAAAKIGITKIRLTGGEPLVRKGVEKLVYKLNRIANIAEIAMTTNAILLTTERAQILREAGLRRLNISLDTLDPERYCELTKGGNLTAALAGIDAAKAAGFERTKINMVIFDATTAAEISAMREFCAESGYELQRIRHFTLTSAPGAAPETPCERPLPCDMCNRLRLTADGFLLPCLRSDAEIKVDFEDVDGCLARAVAAKPLEGISCERRTMHQIGG